MNWSRIWPFGRIAVGMVAALVLSACGDSGTGVDPEPVLELSIAQGQVRPGSFIAIRVAGGGLSGKAAVASLGGVELAVAVQDDSTLLGLTPEVGAGSRLLEVTAGGRSGTLTVQVQAAPPIADAAAVISEELASITAGVPATPPAAFSPEEWTEYGERLDSLVAAAEQQVAALSAEERIAFARIIQAFENDELDFPSGLSLAAIPAVGSLMFPPDCLSTILDAGVATQKTMKALSIVGLGFALSATGVGTPLSVAVGTYGAVKFYESLPETIDSVSAIWTNGLCMRQEAIDVNLSLLGPASRLGPVNALAAAVGSITFEQGVPVRLYLTEQVRPLDASDAGDPALASLTGLLEELRDKIDLLPEEIRSLLPGVPPLPSEVSGGPVTTRPLAASGVRIQNVQPASVELTTTADGTSLLATAEGEVSEDTPFTFDLVSVSDPTISVTVSGVLTGGVAGTYLLQEVDGKQVPAVIDEDEGSREEIISSQLQLNENGTFTMSFRERFTDKETGVVENRQGSIGGTWVHDNGHLVLTIPGDDEIIQGPLAAGIFTWNDDSGSNYVFHKQ